MTEIMVSNDKGRKGIARSLKIDMTPLVDLAFLLITFFIFTTSIGEAKAMKLAMPADGPPMPTPQSQSLTILLGSDNKVYAYAGEWKAAKENGSIKETNYSQADGVGNIIRARQKSLVAANKQATDLVVVIKPTKASNYQNLVNLLDEMLINGVTRYAVIEPTAGEVAHVAPHSY
jgi:biopolymer transport protein ExbD